MIILGIETSCDETSAALVEARGFNFHVLSNVVSSQIKIHAKYGGVVPEVAARNHIVNILSVITEALSPKTYHLKPKIDLIAVTAGPGLLTSLVVGVETARYLGYVWKVPVIATNHLAGHLYSSLLSAQKSKVSAKGGSASGGESQKSKVLFPALGLIVSGGHTELVLVNGYGKHKLIGATLDDAAGEAFDKIAKMLGLPYPGGPHLAKLAEKGNPNAYDFPRGMMNNRDFNFSFSGLKTAVLYFLKNGQWSNVNGQMSSRRLADICASVQAAIVDVLVAKTVAATKKYRVKTVLLGGGVAANTSLRQKLKAALKKELPTTYHLSPITSYCTDNAAMIAAAGYIGLQTKKSKRALIVDPNWDLS